MSLNSDPTSSTSSMVPSNLPALIGQPAPPIILPTVLQTSQYLASFFPKRARDVQWLYHEPRNPRYSATLAPVSRIVCSITPTAGVYTAMYAARTPPPLIFLHRPFTLERKRVPRGANVLSSHVGFDEVLTTGWNEALAARLNLYTGEDAVCIQGYKGDPERRIGLVAAFRTPTNLGNISDRIKHEFGQWDAVHGVDIDSETDMAQAVTVVAIMNAFHPEEVQRVSEAALSKGWISDLDQGDSIVYLTGQAREPGLTAALEKKMKVFCVGHRSCEEWGIRYIASELRREFPMVDVCEVYEDEEPQEPRKPKPKPDLKRNVPSSSTKLPEQKRRQSDIATA
jgi:putative NIF3 family GTP cyclohydrolase 1 type 2